MDLIVGKCLAKTLVTKFTFGKKPVDVCLSFRKETFEIICSHRSANNPSSGGKSGRGNVEESVLIGEIKEIRPGRGSKDFDGPEGKKCDITKSFVIYHGHEFRLKTLSILVQSKEDYENWMKGVHLLVETYLLSYIQKMEIWALRIFDSISANGFLTPKDCQNMTMKLHRKVTSGRVQEILQKKESQLTHSSEGLEAQDFLLLVNEILYDPNPKMQIFTDCLARYSRNSENLSRNGFGEFLIHEQQESRDDVFARMSDVNYLKDYFTTGKDGEATMTIDRAIDYLFSVDNQLWDTEYDKVNQDMSRPLSHYWIATSHNTYITGDQLFSESSIDAYARCLREGCRSVELDVFDGSDEFPVIYHQRTLVTKIPFVDVLYCIRDNAFVTSPYPVILSIENHCSAKQQKVMAKKFQEIFGEMLVVKPLNENESELPSPSQLRGRILLKGKVSIEEEKFLRLSSADDGNEDSSLQHVQKTGKMFIQNQSGQWKPYFFALKDKKLSYIEVEVERTEIETETTEELHLRKKWFHGDVTGGAAEGKRRLLEMDHEGCFLVRTSGSCPGEYTIDFLSEQQAHHIRIQSKYTNGQRLFYLDSQTTFDSIYSLITYYRRHPYETPNFKIERFTRGVPPPESKLHESEPWFYKDIDRVAAEIVLQKIPITGAFLVRYAHGGCRFAISFRYEQMIKHCRVLEDGRYLLVSAKAFETITDLVHYYQRHNFYKDIRLEQPITEDLYRESQSLHETGVKVYTHAGYYDTSNAKYVTVRALHNYVAVDPKCELNFRKDDLIINVQKHGGGWWKGDLGEEREKWFPRNFVMELEVLESPFGSLQTGSVELGTVEVTKNPNGEGKEYAYILKIYGSPDPFRVAVANRSEAEEWAKLINSTLKSTQNPENTFYRLTRKEKKSKIAKELSSLIIYAKSISKLSPNDVTHIGRLHTSMASFDEVKADKTMSADPSFFLWLHQIQLSRIYPQGGRVDSSNFNPMRFWNFGCQMAALNYQTPDKSLQLSQGRFRQNGNCGYVLKPKFLVDENFNPMDKTMLQQYNILPITLKLTVIAGRHLGKCERQKGIKGILRPFVEIEIIGAPFDTAKVQTTSKEENGLNPYWKQKFEFEILNPELTLIRFAVQHEDTFGDAIFVSHATYPIRCLRQGYRSIILRNGFGDELLSTLLVHFFIVDSIVTDFTNFTS